MRHVVGLSGGKDSTALALRLAEVEPRDYDYMCGLRWNGLSQRAYDADQAVSDTPSREWLEALIDAQARKQKKGLKP